MMNEDFAVFILTNRRPNKVYTLSLLNRRGYTGRIYFVIDNEDPTADQYISNYGADKVIVFDKNKVADEMDEFDNTGNRGAVVYARNACFDIAKELGITYFLQLDDDYTAWEYRLFIDKAIVKQIKNLDQLFKSTLDYYKSISAKSVAYGQGGDFIGGLDNGVKIFRANKRKCMNTFFCSTERPFKFIGRINEDVNTYTSYQAQGNLFMTIENVSIKQGTTQKTKGGMSDIYLANGTYIKSFYTIICSPSCVHINMMGEKKRRMHHSISWERAVPVIIDPKYRKTDV